MIDTIYYEEEIIGHPRVMALLQRFPNATPIPCENYKEVFNPSGQNFRLQKKNPSLILAKKKRKASPADSRNLWGRRKEKLLFLPYAQLPL